MAIYKLFPEKDATLYSAYPNQNTGLDEILEASTTFIPNNPQVSRFLIQFSTDEIQNLINNTISGSVTDITGSLLTESKDYKSHLKCFIAEIEGINTDTTLEVFPLAQSWNMGTGKYHDSPKTENGCGWTYRLSSGSGPWETESFADITTGSFLDDNKGGGVWYVSYGTASFTQSQVLNYSSNKDLNVEVTDATTLFYNENITNNGFIVKQSSNSEFQADENKVAEIKYFSIDTHTIYPPELEFRWRDYRFDTGSSTATIITSSQIVATLAENKNFYRRDSIQNFYINCRPQFPTKTYTTSSDYTVNYYLPTASYYAVKDLDTNEFIIDFDSTYTQISADDKGSYFKLYMNGLEPERYYQLLFKTEINGSTLILDDNYYFKVING